ncbi:hypothetical protein [Streptomyces sp. Amel2xC10]|uniref:hypothetical protein n=1 Tax=Streptomyces sp. Amel2xC10 TaxID=1305826 RepID=UPI000A08CB84|nr:hypothetical protein [Streptomyces sp. Amel2xC10]SMF85499.1 hypothetical protein SAMN02745830_06988 [Streptomyces sp. Amel2xC10]
MVAWRPWPGAVVGVLLLVGCTGGGTAEPRPTGSRQASPTPGTPAPSDSPYTVADDQAPRTRAEAVDFVRQLGVRPDHFGAGFRERPPLDSGTATWAVLGADCMWRREPVPDTALASLTRRFELPAADDKGPVYVSLTVTVHRDTTAARRDMAVSLEEALRCPEQRLNATDRVRGLYSRADEFTDGRNSIADDNLVESGEYLVDGDDTVLPFDWFKYRLGPVTVAATGRIGAGRDEEETTAVSQDVAKGVGFTAAEVDRLAKEGSR